MSKSQEDNAIVIKNLSKGFKIPLDKSSGLKQHIVGFLNRKKGYREFQVLRDVSFEIKKGEFFGIVGKNGSGKSTLLKLLAGIYTPDQGLVQVNGSLTPFIELGVGFNHELTGRENVFLNGALLGFSKEEMESMYEEIVDFAELHDFMEEKLKNYSSGMQVRLAFSIAIRADTDILVLDEVLAVGDEAFQRKCEEYFNSVKRRKKTIVLVTHSMNSVRKYCTRAMLIQDGRVVAVGNPEKVADAYTIENLDRGNNKLNKKINHKNKAWIKAAITGPSVLKSTETLNAEIRYQNIDERPVYIKVVVQHSEANIMITNAKLHHQLITKDTKEHVVKFSLNLNDYNWGDCRIVALLVDEKENINLASFGYNSELIFKIPQNTKFAGIMKTTGELELIK